MTIQSIADVEFGAELPAFAPGTDLDNVRAFAHAVGYAGGGRFEDHEQARAQGLPGALVPGIMGMGFLTTLIHRWAPTSTVRKIDTVFRAPVLADHNAVLSAVVTDIEEEERLVHLDLTIKNDADETRVFGTATVEIPA